MSEAIRERLACSQVAALEAEKIILAAYQGTLQVEAKADKTLVTETDRASERKLRQIIEAAFSRDAIIGEEYPEKKGSSGYTWVLDPIDGTEAFVCGVPLFGTMIGLLFEDKPVAGLVHMPALSETYSGARGEGAWWTRARQSTPIKAQVSQTKELKSSLFCTTSQAGFIRRGRMDLYDKLLQNTRKFRGWGSCYGHMLVATGRADLMIDPDVKLWDCAAILPIVTEAGGQFYDLEGKPRIDSGSALSCNSQLANELKALLG